MKRNTLQSLHKLPLKLFYRLVSMVFYKGEKVDRQLYPCFPTYRAAFGEVMNQVYRLCHKTTAYTIQGILIEPTNHCNLRCRHCSIQNRKDIKKGHMEFDLFRHILDTNPQLTCIILTRNGEPFLHPRIFDMIAYARRRSVYVITYTNGILLNEEKINGVFESGLTEINFSMEGVDEYYHHNRGADYAVLSDNIHAVLRERARQKSNLTVGINVALTDDRSQPDKIKARWENLVDYIMVEPLMGQKGSCRTDPCRTLWRNLVVAWDGEVVPCCVDMLSTLVLGNARQQTLTEVFNGENAQKLRAMHLKKNFPAICKCCDTHFG